MAAPLVTLSSSDQLAWLDERSELHQELDWLWTQNERRFEGGHRVWTELWRFDWETLGPQGMANNWDVSDPWLRKDIIPLPGSAGVDGRGKGIWANAEVLRPGEHYRRRQQSATYINFMDALATDVVGQLFKQGPAPEIGLDFGTCGKVRRKEDIDNPTESELIYYNTDGVGIDGSQWDSFWSTQLKLAMVTGYRWIFVEATPEAPRTQGRVRQGFRPYLVAFSPRSVTNFHYENGVLQFAILKIATRKPHLVDGKLEGNRPEDETLLLVRQGWTGFGTEYQGGGWWRYDKNRQLLQNGTWDRTNGQIPLVPLFYDRHPEMFGRPALTELGNASIAAMNLHSCADFDAFDAAASVKALRGVDQKGFNLFIEKVNAGNKYAPLPTNEETGKIPDMQDAAQGAVIADVFEKRLQAIGNAVDRIGKSEVNNAPQASGLAQQAGYNLGNVPRLSLTAGNLEQCQNGILTFIEMRFGHQNPTGSARWTKKFELIKLTSSAQAVLQLEQIAGIWSEELTARVILAAAKDEGFVPDNAASALIDTQLRTAIRDAATAAQQQADQPQIPGVRSTPTPPEPAQTPQEIKSQMDGPNVE